MITNSCHDPKDEKAAEVISGVVDNGGGDDELQQWSVPSGGTCNDTGIKDDEVVFVGSGNRKILRYG